MRIDATIYMDVNKSIKVTKEFDGYEIKQDELTLIVTEEQLEELQYEINKALGTEDVEDLKNTIEELERVVEEQKEQFKELTEIAETKGVAL